MPVTLSGIFMFVKLLQFSNALLPIFITLSGIVTLSKCWQNSNAPSAIFVTPVGIAKEVTDFSFGKRMISVFSLLYKTPFSEQ